MAGRDRRDEPPARDPGGLQHRARHRADDDRQGHPRPQRPAPGRRRGHGRLRVRAGGARARGRRARHDEDREARRPDGGRDALGGQGARVRARGGAPRRDPADPAAGPRAGPVRDRRRAPRSGARPTAGGGASSAERAAARHGPPRPPARPADEAGSRGHVRDGPAGRRGAGAPRRRAARRVDEGTAADWLPGIRDEHDDDDGLAGPLARPARRGIGRSRRTSGAGRGRGRDVAAADHPGRRGRHRPRCPVHSHAGSGTASDRRIRPRARQISARVASSVRPSCEAISRVR